ncbi:hypothetical protein DPMN_000011 [Dreissena polymorpha]|uniref:Uncharacterized protein n=1 Tax=Dreissena polymorpha TaxID=45954 RepID=A0A9D4MIW4_DREPO|nr:hypothetical protein DPMN_000011 [Dreissena polymorpha]
MTLTYCVEITLTFWVAIALTFWVSMTLTNLMTLKTDVVGDNLTQLMVGNDAHLLV